MNMLKAGVVGVGHLGYHHARNFSSLPSVELTGVADTDEKRARDVASEFAAEAFTDFRALTSMVDVVSVAVPTSKHYMVAEHFLKNNKHVLLEKPIATTLEEADRLIRLSEENGLTLQIGHSERFNAAVIRLSEENGLTLQIGHSERFNAAVDRLREQIEKPIFIESHRLAPFTPRGCDVDVVLDLMIHDLDIILSLLDTEVEKIIDAVGVPLISEYEDIANARLLFGNGCVANVTASRISAEPMRKIRIFQPYTYFSLDYAAQEIKSYRLQEGPIDWENPQALIIDEISVKKEEPLKREIEAFIASVLGNHPAVVTARDGRKALDVAVQVAAFMRNRKYE
jgi:predicted dehydrogenase